MWCSGSRNLVFVQPFENAILLLNRSNHPLFPQSGWAGHLTSRLACWSSHSWCFEAFRKPCPTSCHCSFESRAAFVRTNNHKYLPVTYPLAVAEIPRASRGTRRRAIQSWIHSSHSRCEEKIYAVRYNTSVHLYSYSTIPADLLTSFPYEACSTSGELL